MSTATSMPSRTRAKPVRSRLASRSDDDDGKGDSDYAVPSDPPSSASAISISDGESDFDSSPPTKRRRVVGPQSKVQAKGPRPRNKGTVAATAVPDIEDGAVHRPHAAGYHGVQGVVNVQEALLAWFEQVRCVWPRMGASGGLRLRGAGRGGGD